ncbi:MAG: hypothetical protein ABJJ25_17200 [Eudoraea sp.]|uniref:hypothetical protein n=1 Tax=Eudoraea sp. TaxID=1979955 RepID=UPI0032658A12
MKNKSKNSVKEVIVQKIKAIVNFVKNPDNKLSRSYDIKKNLKSVLTFYLIKLFFLSLWIIVMILFLDFEPAPVVEIRNKMSPLSFLLYALLLGPILEEAIFRLSLVFKPWYITISVLLLTYVLTSKLVYGIGHLNIEDHLLVRILISILFALITYFFANKYLNYFLKFWNVNFRWIYYCSIIFFALLHLNLLELTFNKFLLFPLLTFPQLLGGTINGYIRIKYGFIYSCLFHGINNILPAISVL